MKKKSLIILFLAFLLSCNETKNKIEIRKLDTTSRGNETRKETFNFFYKKFLNDTNFRNSRIIFPIKGYNSDDENNTDDYLWFKDEWDFYFTEDLNYNKDQSIISKIEVSDSIAKWRLYKENSGYDIIYSFRLEEDKWYLHYYSHKNY